MKDLLKDAPKPGDDSMAFLKWIRKNKKSMGFHSYTDPNIPNYIRKSLIWQEWHTETPLGEVYKGG